MIEQVHIVYFVWRPPKAPTKIVAELRL